MCAALCAPVGSVLVGTKEFITQAKRNRKMLGGNTSPNLVLLLISFSSYNECYLCGNSVIGGMRQAGVLAAAGLIALTQMSTRLHEDHENATLLAEGLQKLVSLSVCSLT